jgi:hypothetical protein
VAALELCQCRVEDMEEVRAFIGRVFPIDINAFRPEVMRWKYFEPHPYWEGSRSYVLRYNGKIAAHTCLIPIRLPSQSKILKTACGVDWIAGKVVPGAGGAIFKKLLEKVDLLFAIGGTDDALSVIPKLGFKSVGNLQLFRRVVKPIKRFMARKPTSLRPWAGLVKDVAQLRVAPAHDDRWKIQDVLRFDESINDVLRAAEPDGIHPERDAAFLNYVLDCPAVPVHGHLLLRDGNRMGYAVTSETGATCRIAELRLASSVAQDWTAAYAAITRHLAQKENCVEVSASDQFSHSAHGLMGAGFSSYTTSQVSILPGSISFRGRLSVGQLEYDGFYL